MGMTLAEKILAAHCGQQQVHPGQFILADVDIALGNDITAPLAIEEFQGCGAEKVFDKDRVVLIPDHFAPNKDIKAAQQCKMMRQFARAQNLTNYFEVGEMGIEHALLPEQGLVGPGDVVIGADSHTCTYGALGAFATGVGSTDLAFTLATGKAWFRVPESMKFVFKGTLNPWVTGKDLILYTIGDIGVEGARYRAMEFTGEAISNLSQDSRFAMSNMAIEAGGKAGLIAPDSTTREYIKNRFKREPRFHQSDPDAQYCDVREYDVARIQPQVSLPHLPSNAKAVGDVGDIAIDQVVIGSCTNGRMEDLRIAAKIMAGRKVAKGIRCIILPGTQQIYLEALREGLVEQMVQAGAAFSTPTCGPCLGGHMGILAEGERALATTNRNFVGRMGHPKSEVYLC
ncbi:MAG TPA: 3-isopropylmalate dehydratase large subunit, partial [bacterium]|nr:3-isopropylmalate dehydratase large subunit [bacterium]